MVLDWVRLCKESKDAHVKDEILEGHCQDSGCHEEADVLEGAPKVGVGSDGLGNQGKDGKGGCKNHPVLEFSEGRKIR